MRELERAFERRKEVLLQKIALYYVNGAGMSIGKYVNTVLAVILSAFITYHAVSMLNSIEASTSLQILVKLFIIVSIIYTCGTLIPPFILRVQRIVITVINGVSKKYSNTKY
ncbi:hypothetical protein [[Enterobacter] lignolyticus]|uniref:Uncharacterized protein n=1 Tax=[Enterobacter] lignolyticus TaxID=1334193 RepID=A0A806X9Q5_9ENTR|nr:hypothetical protein [[Enterobacter] lignolyticus]ALR78698.1 hypothetical protein AO703_21175 [[Enterobacter] lignolyticus]